MSLDPHDAPTQDIREGVVSPSAGTEPAPTPSVRGGRALGTVAVVAVVAALIGGGVVATADRTISPTSSVVVVPASVSTSTGVLNVAGILAKAEPAVVTVRTRLVGTNAMMQPVAEQGTGTGVIVGADGVIVTNNHVVAGAQTISVQLADGRQLPGTVVGTAPGSDLAVLRIDATGLPTVTLGDSNTVRVGDPVVAIGNALALPGGPTVTEGIISARERTITTDKGAQLEHLLQTSAAINPGNSGGPLLNAAGEVIGINTAGATSGQNIGFAIAVSPAGPIIEQLKAGQSVTQPYLGVQTASVTDTVRQRYNLTATAGAVVLSVTPGTPADKAGLKPGDVITAVAGTTVQGSDDLGRLIDAHRPGDRLTFLVTTGTASHSASVTLGSRPTGL